MIEELREAGGAWGRGVRRRGRLAPPEPRAMSSDLNPSPGKTSPTACVACGYKLHFLGMAEGHAALGSGVRSCPRACLWPRTPTAAQPPRIQLGNLIPTHAGKSLAARVSRNRENPFSLESRRNNP